MSGPTQQLAAFASALRYESVPGDVIEKTKSLVLDALGCCLYGSTLEWTRIIADMVRDQGGNPEASVWGSPDYTSVSQAVLVNATAGHAAELDDMHVTSVLHAGSLAVPVAVACAEYSGSASGRELIAAIIAGYEVGLRAGAAATSSLFMRGFHPQGTSGVFVAAAAAARMLGLNAHETQHALAIAGSQAAGLMAAQEGAMAKRMHCGRAAQSGVYGALLAKRGFTGIPNVLEAEYGGFLSSMSDKPERERLTAGLNEQWEIRRVGYKPYATVASIQAPLQSLRELMALHRLTAEDIASMHVRCGTMTYQHCAWPYTAQGVTAAQMNLFFGLAVMALDGDAFIHQFNEGRLNDPKVLALIPRITAEVDPAIDAMGPEFRHASRLRLETRDGRSFEEERRHRPGSAEAPLSKAEIEKKFTTLASQAAPAGHCERIIELVSKLEAMSDTADLVSLLAVEPAAPDMFKRKKNARN